MKNVKPVKIQDKNKPFNKLGHECELRWVGNSEYDVLSAHSADFPEMSWNFVSLAEANSSNPGSFVGKSN